MELVLTSLSVFPSKAQLCMKYMKYNSLHGFWAVPGGKHKSRFCSWLSLKSLQWQATTEPQSCHNSCPGLGADRIWRGPSLRSRQAAALGGSVGFVTVMYPGLKREKNMNTDVFSSWIKQKRCVLFRRECYRKVNNEAWSQKQAQIKERFTDKPDSSVQISAE